jgi:acetyl-CoA synthetase
MEQSTTTYSPSEAFRAGARVSTFEEYQRLYQESVTNPEAFWARLASTELEWFRNWDSVLHYDPSAIGERAEPYLKWFSGGELNVCYNCLDRHLKSGNAHKTAILWQGEREEERRSLTYFELHEQVCKLANGLKQIGARKGDTLTIFLPMIPEAVIAMLACARIGVMHSVVFSAFSAEALRSRMEDCQSKFVITSDFGFHGGKIISLKHKVDEALNHYQGVKGVIVFDRSGQGLRDIPMTPARDHSWNDLVDGQSANCPAESFESETPLFALYTSGSTGKPKGVMHTSAGYLLYAHTTFKYVFDHRPDDIFFCTADVGWITGHSYVCYGPLSNAATVVMFEGVPTWPTPDRFWRIIDHFRVTVLYTAPTAIRALMRFGEEIPASFKLNTLRLLGSVGEPINPEAWRWYYEHIGHGRCPVVDTWWQTETGGILITTLPGAHEMKPGSAGYPFFGIVPKVFTEEEGGPLFLEKPWPGMLRGVYGDEKSELIKTNYFSRREGLYFTGDGCRVDDFGQHTLLGRIDDVLNVSAHRLATAELESALVAHPSVAEAAVVGFPHQLKGQGIYCFVTLKKGVTESDELKEELKQWVRHEIGPIATPDKLQFASGLPKTRSGKIMRRILRKIAEGQTANLGDTSTLAEPAVVESLVKGRIP